MERKQRVVDIMDINSLLSPDDTPTSTSTPSPRTTPIYHHHHHHHSDSQQQQQQERTKSKLQTSTTSGNPSTSSQHHSASTKSNAVFAMSMSPPDRPITASRRAASGIDTLADLASMQQHSQRVSGPNNPKTIRKHDTYEKQPTAQGERPSLESITRAHSGSRSSLDIHMEDAPMKIPQPRAFESNSLSDENLILIRQLASYLAENPNAFESHLRLIKILRYGLLSHVHATEESPEEQDPITYDLLPDLRQAREAMTTRFTMGEEAWVERLQDEMLLARTLEDCLHIVELFEKAVADEAGSTRLWTMFGDWEAALYSVSNPSDQSITQFHDGLNRWISLTDNDCLVIAEVFGRSQIVEVWKRGAENVKYNINDSHLVWNKYTELLQLELGSRHSREKINALRKHFLDRLQTPHSNWDETFQKFSTFTSRYDNKAYEETMVQTSRKAEPSKVMFAAREVFEIELARALGSEDKITAWTKLNEYLEWEITQSRKKKVPFFSFELANALYQRATLLFPSDANLWEDHLVFLEQESEFRQEHISTLALLGRACDHCPWSGKLWSLYIQAAERQKLNFADIGQIKHKATSTGLLDSTSMEDILTIHTAWCSFLRRRAFSKEATDEEEDVAEVGIRSAIEDMESLGRRKEGKDYKGDPQYRLERIYIKFLAQNRKFDLARAEWKKLTSRQGNFSEYWLRYYTWEMHFWSYELGKTGVPSAQYGPKEPTKVLQQAAKRAVKTDWPEKILETYLVHCQDYEDVAAIDTAMIVYRRSMKDVKKRRELEAAAQKQAEAEAKLYADEGIASLTNGYAVKRKWEEDDDALEQGVKKSKGIDDAELRGHKIEAQPEVKRDRENSTVIVRNLPVDTPENWVQHYLNDCGEIKSILLSTDDGIGTATATVEFRSHQDALAALTKDQRLFRNQPIQISLGTGTTLYITNFPPQADEAWIRDLFKAVSLLYLLGWRRRLMILSMARLLTYDSHHSNTILIVDSAISNSHRPPRHKQLRLWITRKSMKI